MSKILYSILIIFILNQNVSNGSLFDWMMPKFLLSNQTSDSIFDFNFENSFKALKESLFNLEDDLNKLKSQLPDFANQNVSLNLAGIFFPNETDLNTYYSLGGCECDNITCSCCAHIEIDRLNLNDTVCLNFTYLSNDLGIEFEFSVNNVVYLNQTISVTNPPLACFGYKETGSLCFKFYELNIHNRSISGCLDIVAKVADIEIVTVKVGCFRSGPNSKYYQQSIVSLHSNGTTTYYNQINSDSAKNLIIKSFSILNKFNDRNSSSNHSITNSFSSNNFFSSLFGDRSWKLNSNDLVFKRKKRD
jgi:hypothetical protein